MDSEGLIKDAQKLTSTTAQTSKTMEDLVSGLGVKLSELVKPYVEKMVGLVSDEGFLVKLSDRQLEQLKDPNGKVENFDNSNRSGL